MRRCVIRVAHSQGALPLHLRQGHLRIYHCRGLEGKHPRTLTRHHPPLAIDSKSTDDVGDPLQRQHTGDMSEVESKQQRATDHCHEEPDELPHRLEVLVTSAPLAAFDPKVGQHQEKKAEHERHRGMHPPPLTSARETAEEYPKQETEWRQDRAVDEGRNAIWGVQRRDTLPVYNRGQHERSLEQPPLHLVQLVVSDELRESQLRALGERRAHEPIGERLLAEDRMAQLVIDLPREPRVQRRIWLSAAPQLPRPNRA
mmetsp:Transcript_7798/g.13559  ORF Transcript_7798/g.13559 Transcript_7798/m.13559 type:complete len:257 (-) Transcript_7798:431-1201(-)